MKDIWITALGCLIAIGGDAKAGIIVYRYADHFEEDLIVNHDDIFIAGFTPVLTTAPATPGSVLHNSMRFAFRPGGSSGVVSLVSGNDLPLYPPEPFQTLSLVSDGGLNQLGTLIQTSRDWVDPQFDLSTGAVSPAAMGAGVINIGSIPDDGYGYVGYAVSDLSMFGYMQIQRLSLFEWRLIGYAYDDSGAPISVQNLVPSSGTLMMLGAASGLNSRRRRPAK